MVYDTKYRFLTKENGEKIKLTKLEHKLLIALANEKLTFYNKIIELVYGYKYKRYIYIIKNNLCKKTGLKIRAINNRGYILETDIAYK